ncbi:peroxisome biogenesis factor 10 [Polyrhizophydium stewartii]|uniref:RING-type E3 ubiquitin transferase n=1 Tax=Polyrhizophydium stewartii TaxID=2732419 RepID=A0ABR4NA31_9FUNG|nr:peroxisome biogenesis factor 10 [Polyrhizophydium stewartii]
MATTPTAPSPQSLLQAQSSAPPPYAAEKMQPAQRLPTASFPFAAPPDIIRSTQKDALYIFQLNSTLSEIIGNLWGSRTQLRLAREVQLLSEALYHGLTTLAGTQTLGEEYCDIVQVAGGRSATFPRQLACFALQVLGPYVVDRCIKVLKKSETDGSLRQIPPSIKRGLVRAGQAFRGPIASLHLANFYIFGAYYHMSKRLTGVRYVLLRRLREGEPAVGYEVLSVLIYVQLLVQAYHKWSKRRAVSDKTAPVDQDYDDSHLEPSDDQTVGESQKCTLCLMHSARSWD